MPAVQRNKNGFFIIIIIIVDADDKNDYIKEIERNLDEVHDLVRTSREILQIIWCFNMNEP